MKSSTYIKIVYNTLANKSCMKLVQNYFNKALGDNTINYMK